MTRCPWPSTCCPPTLLKCSEASSPAASRRWPAWRGCSGSEASRPIRWATQR
uniref:Alternative protein n=1 Tax=Macrostomum lignano TaxID=282301 RepID=A0A1I8JAZ0_9PLAT